MYYISLILILLTIIISKFIFKVSIKEMKKIENNDKINQYTDKFPENNQIAKEMLTIINNPNVIVEENKNIKSSFYFVLTNKISIANLSKNYARIQTIAHECLHSIQDKTLLYFNFFFSNLYLLYFILISIFSIANKIANPSIQIFILALFGLMQFVVRAFLEIDAMTKSTYLAKEYIENKKILSIDENKIVINEYENINKIAISFVLNNLLFTFLIKIFIYILFVII